MPEAPEKLHPLVKAWLAQHKAAQATRAKELRNPSRFSWPTEPLPDLTVRDLYRFSATSAIFTAVERAGGSVAEAPISGKIVFLAASEKIECSIVEKMFKPLKGDGSWTAYPEHHQTGLQSTGFLRVRIDTYIAGKRPEWIETKEKRVGDLLQEIAAAVISAGHNRAQSRKEQQEAARCREEEEVRRRELHRVREIDDRKWARFCECADNLDQCAKLRAFVVEIKARCALEGDIEVGGRTLDAWTQWAEERISALDPFRSGVGGLFEFVAGKLA